MRLPTNTQLGELRIVDVYEYYDGPRLFVSENTAGQSFLTLSVEDLPDGEGRWLFSPTSQKRLETLGNGLLDLHSAYAASEDGFVFEAVTDPGGDIVSAVPVTQLDSVDLPLEGELLGPAMSAESSPLVPVAPLHAAQSRRETVRVALRPAGIIGFEAPSRLVGQVLVGFQELVSAVGQSVEGVATTRGRISPDVLKATELRTIGAFAGSFGMELASATLSDLFGESTMADSLAKVDELLAAGADESKLGEVLDELKPRVASKYTSLIRLLADNHTGIAFDWGSVSARPGAFRLFDSESLGAISATLALTNTADTSTFSVTGVLVGLNTRTGSFEIEEQIGNSRFRGRADRSRFDSDEEFTINGVYRATIEETVEVSGLTGEETMKRVLVDLEDADASSLDGRPSANK